MVHGFKRLKRSLVISLIVSLLMATWVVLLSAKPAHAATPKTYYVNITTGQDRSDYGLSTSTPFKNIQYAADLTNPGDTVYVMDGTYYKTNDQDVFHVTRSGDTTGGYINYLAYPGHHPKLKSIDAWNHIVISASYIKIDGFEIEGDNANLTLADGEARYNHYVQNKATNTVDWNYVRKTQTNGICVKPGVDLTTPHDIRISNNIVHDVPGGGISVEKSDYVTVENNTVYNNSWYTLYATSGISFLTPKDADSNTTLYRNVIRNNRVYNNKTLVKWEKTQDYSDGNGIIIDSTLKAPAYTGKTLVTNNVTYLNGGSGIHSFQSSNVDIINNTSYQNSSQLNYGEIFAQSSDQVNILNNILVARTGKNINTNYSNTNVTTNYNVYDNGNPVVSGPNDIWSDPLFVNAASGDFHLSIGSKAIDTGGASLTPTNDFDYNPRPRGAAPDRGAYESQNLIGNPSFEWGSLSGGWTKEQNSAGIAIQNTGSYSGTYKAAFNTTAATKLSQTVTAPSTKTYTVTAYVVTNIASNVIVGADIAGVNQSQQAVSTGGYKKITFTVNATAGQLMKVWISAPLSASGWVGIDDVSLQ